MMKYYVAFKNYVVENSNIWKVLLTDLLSEKADFKTVCEIIISVCGGETAFSDEM